MIFNYRFLNYDNFRLASNIVNENNSRVYIGYVITGIIKTDVYFNNSDGTEFVCISSYYGDYNIGHTNTLTTDYLNQFVFSTEGNFYVRFKDEFETKFREMIYKAEHERLENLELFWFDDSLKKSYIVMAEDNSIDYNVYHF